MLYRQSQHSIPIRSSCTRLPTVTTRTVHLGRCVSSRCKASTLVRSRSILNAMLTSVLKSIHFARISPWTALSGAIWRHATTEWRSRSSGLRSLDPTITLFYLTSNSLPGRVSAPQLKPRHQMGSIVRTPPRYREHKYYRLVHNTISTACTCACVIFCYLCGMPARFIMCFGGIFAACPDVC